MEEFIGADPITFDHALLFKKLQSYSLEWRLHDPYSSLVSAKSLMMMVLILCLRAGLPLA